MSIEELLKPRYKVIADYPFRDHFLLSEIIELNEFDGRNHLSKDMQEWFVIKPKLNGTGSPMSWYESNFNKYPHLFKRLEWWEERDEKDMPEYVKHKIDAEVYKLKKQAETTPSDAYCVKRASIESESYYQWLSLYDLLPATYEEYEQYLQSQK
jgi:hypothetical protein